jgi:hypothetical protein
MPTVLRLGRYRVAIYPNDHRPPHVHVIGDGHEAVFELGREGLVLRENYGFSRSEIAAIRREIEAQSAVLLAAWERIHG